MTKSVRAAAFAAAAFFLAASAVWGGPLLAVEGNVGAVEAPWFGHADAGAQVSDLGFNPDAGLDSPLSAAEEAAVETPAATRPRPAATLAAHVAGLADGETQGAEEDCLASAVYFEARGESLEGQLAVAEVVINRAASGRYPATLCEVVRQPWQFSFVRRGIIPRADRGSDAWRRAVAVARIAKTGARRLLDQNVLWYHANYVSPSWGRRLARSGQIGAHIFYR
jgi:spore germination cell wall hydrolase CwlJ-like protein